MSGSDTIHVLRVTKEDREVVHTAECQREVVADVIFGTAYEEFTCPVGSHVSMWGFDDLVDQEGRELADLAEGDYPLVLEWYTPVSMFEDAEVNFYISGAARDTDKGAAS